MLVAPDTASVVTRPPTNLLATSIAAALERKPHLIVYILPSYTDNNATARVFPALSTGFDHRIFMLPAEPGPTLIEITALIDQADVFVTGDTGGNAPGYNNKETEKRRR